MYSHEFVLFFGISLLALLCLAIGYVGRIIVTSGKDIDSINPISSPLLVALGVSTAGWPFEWVTESLGTTFAYGFVYGLATGLLGFTFLRVPRDIVLSAISVILLIPLLRERFAEGLEVAFLLGLLMLAVGFVISLMRFSMRHAPTLGLSALGLIEVIDFLVSPFGLSYWEYTSAYSGPVTIIAAVLIGLSAAINPRLAIGLGVLAVVGGQVLWNLFIWFANENGELRNQSPDWTSGAMLLACCLGFVLTWGFWTSRWGSRA